MKLLKVSLIAVITLSLCSFAYYSMDDGRDQLYKDFLSEFAAIQLPKKIVFKAPQFKNDLKPQQNKKAEQPKSKVLTYDYESFIPGLGRGRMSRMGPSTYEAEVLLTANETFNAVIYSESRAFDRDAKSFILATYDDKGKQIDLRYLGYASPKNTIEMMATSKLELTIKEIQKEENTGKKREAKKMFITPKGDILVHGEEDIKIKSKQLKMPIQKRI